ncbi:hypothetical protein RHECNPAF_890010 [Rhizobium etli CNPAF512]|nr:hypothetical protein RHECNPAF_890010 [Rhizobium etli CNPAF512]
MISQNEPKQLFGNRDLNRHFPGLITLNS